jgi:hypothetical protein
MLQISCDFPTKSSQNPANPERGGDLVRESYGFGRFSALGVSRGNASCARYVCAGAVFFENSDDIFFENACD